MTIQHAPPSTNGRTAAASTDTGSAAPRPAPARSHLAVRPRRLLVPALLALGVILILRHFEQSTAAS